MRSTHSLKCLQALQDEMRSMSTNDVWDIEEITKGAKQQAVNGSTKQTVTPKRMYKNIKHNLC